MQYISAKPTLYLSQFLPNFNSGIDVFPFNNDQRCYYFYSARYALAAAIKALGLEEGDTILVPSYNCGAEVDPLLASRINVLFYRIKKDLAVDLDDLSRKVKEKVRAIIITHFLGFPQPVDEIQKICAMRKIFLIEDCAHAFLSNYKERPLGSFGDASFFSMLKTLPVLNGGLLVLGNDSFQCKQNTKSPNIFATLFYTSLLLRLNTHNNKEFIKEHLMRIVNNSLFLTAESIKMFLLILKKVFKTGVHNFVRPDSYLFIDELADWSMSSLSMNVIRNTDIEKIKDIRQRNFNYLLKHFVAYENINLPFRELPQGVCPLFFPIIVESPDQREKLYQGLRERGVVTHPWWKRFHPDVPWDQFPDAVYLKRRLFGLPIHQDLTLKHMDRIIEEFEKAYNKSRD
jgi:perosamine synthetase